MGLKRERKVGSRGSITCRSLLLAAKTSEGVGLAGAHASVAFSALWDPTHGTKTQA